MKRMLCVILTILLLASAGSIRQAAADTAGPTPEPTPIDFTYGEATAEPQEDEPEATPTPTPVPTKAPEETPFQTRVPMEGDVATDRFPNYDTGADAQYSYQSDELRIAIHVIRDTEAHQRIFVADIWLRNLRTFRTGFAHGKYQGGTEDGSVFANRENAILAINGNYAIGRLSVHDGKSYSNLKNTTGWSRSGFCGLYSDGTVRTFELPQEKLNLKNELAAGLVQGWQFGPVLVKNGEKTTRDFHVPTLHPRCMLGYYEPGHYVFVTCDGRRENAIGMSIDDMREYMYSLGVQEAFNLDGGYSAVMVFMGTVINNPAWVKLKSDGTGLGRPINDMLMVSEYDENGEIVPLTELQPDIFTPVEEE